MPCSSKQEVEASIAMRRRCGGQRAPGHGMHCNGRGACPSGCAQSSGASARVQSGQNWHVVICWRPKRWPAAFARPRRASTRCGSRACLEQYTRYLKPFNNTMLSAGDGGGGGQRARGQGARARAAAAGRLQGGGGGGRGGREPQAGKGEEEAGAGRAHVSGPLAKPSAQLYVAVSHSIQRGVCVFVRLMCIACVPLLPSACKLTAVQCCCATRASGSNDYLCISKAEVPAH